MKIQHPRDASQGVNPPSRIDIGRGDHRLVEDGHFTVPDDEAAAVMSWLADAYDVDYQEDGQVAGATDTSLDWEAFAELGYQDRVTAVEEGRVDVLLEKVLDEDGSETVTAAAAERQAALEGEE